jgi:hypothetical protein
MDEAGELPASSIFVVHEHVHEHVYVNGNG